MLKMLIAEIAQLFVFECVGAAIDRLKISSVLYLNEASCQDKSRFDKYIRDIAEDFVAEIWPKFIPQTLNVIASEVMDYAAYNSIDILQTNTTSGLSESIDSQTVVNDSGAIDLSVALIVEDKSTTPKIPSKNQCQPVAPSKPKKENKANDSASQNR